MKILQVCSATWFGGGEKHLADLINGLRARGHEVFLAAPVGAPLLEKIDLPPENIFAVEVRNALDLTASRKLTRLIRKYEIDVIHAHLGRDYFPVALAARFAARAKIVLTRHVLFPMKTVHRFALANVSRVIAVSGAVESKLRAQSLFAAEKIVRIPNGIELDHWRNPPQESAQESFRIIHGIPQDALLIGSVGELKVLKGTEDLVLAAEIVLRQFPGAHFVLVGKDNEASGGFKKYLQELAVAGGAGSSILWLDRIEDTAPLLHALDVFVSPSHSESFGLAILEAMAAGCAIAATDTEGATELLARQDLVPVGNGLKLAAAICGLLGNKEKRLEEGRRNQELAQHYDLRKMIDATEKLYLEL
jgi:glycosyltransferase involved in cell wall biosynthesis